MGRKYKLLSCILVVCLALTALNPVLGLAAQASNDDLPESRRIVAYLMSGAIKR